MYARPIVVALSSIVLSYSDFISEPHESGVAFSNVSGIHRAPDKHRYFSLQMEKKTLRAEKIWLTFHLPSPAPFQLQDGNKGG